MERRIRRLGIFLILCFGAIFVQLNNIQVLKANSLANNPSNPAVLAVQRSQPRGSILSADGIVLASSVPNHTGYYKYKRVYNADTAPLFSQIIGFDSEIYGRSGVEASYNQYLQSHTRPAHSLRDLLVDRTTTDNVTLTISSHLQLQVAGIVDGLDANGRAPLAAAVVLDVKTGAVLAMSGVTNLSYQQLSGLASPDAATERYTWASLNPNSPSSPLISQAYQNGVQPGSTFKVVTSSAVYDHNPAVAKVNYPGASCINGPGQPPPVQGRIQPLCNYNSERCGGTIQTTLPQSCDTAFAQMGMALGPNLGTEAAAFGFNRQPPLDLPPSPSQISSFPSPAALTNDQALAATAAFGQGFGSGTVIASPLQMALATEGIANQGVIMTPHVMAQIRDSQGNLVENYAPHPWLTATSPLTAAAVTHLMQGVTSLPGATAQGVFPASWNVAAKTGTAETGQGPLGNSLTNDWMVAFAPANNPKVAVAVSVPNQPPSATGAGVSGPPTRAILGDALGLTH